MKHSFISAAALPTVGVLLAFWADQAAAQTPLTDRRFSWGNLPYKADTGPFYTGIPRCAADDVDARALQMMGCGEGSMATTAVRRPIRFFSCPPQQIRYAGNSTTQNQESLCRESSPKCFIPPLIAANASCRYRNCRHQFDR